MSATPIPTPQEQIIPSSANALKALLLFASFYLAVTGATWLDARGEALWIAVIKWTWIAVLTVANVVFIVGMGVLAHDAVHRVLFRAPFWNELGGSLLSAATLIPFYAYRQFHLTHHSTAHQAGRDPENVMHDHSFIYAMSVGSVIALFEQYRYLFNNLRGVAGRHHFARFSKDILALTVAAILYFGVVPVLLGMPLIYTVLPTLVMFPWVFGWRALSDHYAIPPIERAQHSAQPLLDVDEEAWHRDRERRQREIIGWVALTHPWLEWLWSHVNYHEVHHKYPWLSHQYLKSVFAATRCTQPYLIVNGYWRLLWNLRGRPYYGARTDLRRFLSTPDW